MKARTILLFLALFAFGCATQPKKKKQEPELANPTVMKQDIKVVKEDAAAKAFQEEAAYIQQDAKKGKIDYGDVNSRMDDVLRKHPNYALAWFNKGVSLEKLGKLKEAEDAYRKAIALNAALREAHENLAALLARRGDPSEAASIMRELAARDPGAAGARIQLAKQALAQGDFDEAQSLCQDALVHQPKNIGAYCILAQVAVKQKDYLRARLLSALGFKIDKSAACLHDVLGQVALDEGQTAIALKAFETAVQSNPGLVQPRFRIAQISMGVKDFKKAIDNYVAITQIDPKNMAAFVNLGIALKGSGRFDEAEKAYQQAIQVSDGNGSPASAYFNLGVLYLRDLKKPDLAQEQLKRVLQLGDGDDDLVFKMLEEIEMMKRADDEMKRMEEEQKLTDQIEKKQAEETAKQQKLDEEIQKKVEAEEKSRGVDEPDAPPPPAAKEDTPPIESKKKKSAPKKEKKEKKKEDPKEPSDPLPKPDDFE